MALDKGVAVMELSVTPAFPMTHAFSVKLPVPSWLTS